MDKEQTKRLIKKRNQERGIPNTDIWFDLNLGHVANEIIGQVKYYKNFSRHCEISTPEEEINLEENRKEIHKLVDEAIDYIISMKS